MGIKQILIVHVGILVAVLGMFYTKLGGRLRVVQDIHLSISFILVCVAWFEACSILPHALALLHPTVFNHYRDFSHLTTLNKANNPAPPPQPHISVSSTEALSVMNTLQSSKPPMPGFRDLPNVILSPMIRHSGLVFAIVRIDFWFNISMF